MATSFGAAAGNVVKSSAYCHRHFLLRSNSSKVSFRLSPRPKLRFSSKGLQSGWSSSSIVKVQLNEIGAGASSKASASTASEAEVSPTESEDVKLSDETSVVPSEESIREFMAQVSSLVQLVDSTDIMELEMKQPGCEVVIRKKEALPQPPAPLVTYVQSPQPTFQAAYSAPSTAPATAPSSPPPAATPSPPKALPSGSSHPPLTCPMAGTFYRCPAPGEPPFVKVGDKVSKGQVLCIVEAMKLMNEIESDRSGTIVEVLHEDAKPVSVGSPLFVIAP